MRLESVAVACLMLTAFTTPQAQTSDCQATVFVLQDLEREPAVPSPDGNLHVVLGVKSEDDENGWLRVHRGQRVIGTFTLRDLSGGVFLKWAPDSRAFYFMWSNGGASGGYSVRLFHTAGSQVKELHSTAQSHRDFARRYPCPARGHNTFPIRWVNGSEQLLVAQQVYPTGDCGRHSGRYGGYIVRVADGAILERYSEPQLKRLWPEGCPSAIYPTGFWGSEDLKKATEQLRRRRGRIPRH